MKANCTFRSFMINLVSPSQISVTSTTTNLSSASRIGSEINSTTSTVSPVSPAASANIYTAADCTCNPTCCETCCAILALRIFAELDDPAGFAADVRRLLAEYGK